MYQIAVSRFRASPAIWGRTYPDASSAIADMRQEWLTRATERREQWLRAEDVAQSHGIDTVQDAYVVTGDLCVIPAGMDCATSAEVRRAAVATTLGWHWPHDAEAPIMPDHQRSSA